MIWEDCIFFTYLILSNLQIPSLDSRKPLAGSSMRLIAPLMFAAERRMMKVKLSLDMRVMYSERWSVVVVGAEAEAIFVRGELEWMNWMFWLIWTGG